jgi:hypothetical protein
MAAAWADPQAKPPITAASAKAVIFILSPFESAAVMARDGMLRGPCGP